MNNNPENEPLDEEEVGDDDFPEYANEPNKELNEIVRITNFKWLPMIDKRKKKTH